MKIIAYGILIFNILFFLGCGENNDKDTSTNSTEINYTNFDGNISRLYQPEKYN